MRIYEAERDQKLLEAMIAMSEDWEAENSTRGYRKNDGTDLEGMRIFIAEQGGEILGYLFGQENRAKRTNSVISEGTCYFEIEELYVVPAHRSEGIGRKLFCFVEQEMKSQGMEFLMLSTATKDYKKILHFYIEELGMDFWSARLFKKL
ncbi:MAG: GNAT family N-acetyltransferase [Oscillospiraceae bacterium]|nr:GNAT family N-acetyltransferase [Oscillospiraceae bacterium]